MSKSFRCFYFRNNPIVKETRRAIGPETFDKMYRQLYGYLSKLHIGQYFVVSKMCRNNPDNHDLVVLMCDIYANMDFFVNLEYDEQTDRITILPTTDGRTEGLYSPPDVYSKIVKDPKGWGVNPNDLF